MRAAAGFCLFFVLIALSSAGLPSPKFNGAYDYHRTIGIPQATKIREAEAAAVANENGRIIGGSSSTILSHPYQAGLIMTILYIFTSVCGGTIIANDRLITAAHCYNDGSSSTPQAVTVVAGSSLLFTGGIRTQYLGITISPGYNPVILANDIAIVHIEPLTFSLTVSPIILPTGSEINQNFNGWIATASGFGRTSDDSSIGLLQTLHSVNLQVISNEECQAVYGSAIQSHMMCTSGEGGVGTCSGDSGGPLTVISNGRKILVGISSFVAQAGCEAGLPAGYTRISDFISWIYSVV